MSDSTVGANNIRPNFTNTEKGEHYSPLQNTVQSQKKQFFDTVLTFFALAISVYFLISCCVHHEISGYIRPEQQITAVFNSNQLFIPYLYQDIFIHHAPWSDWILSPVPFLFPDGLIFFIIVSIFRNIVLSIFLANAALAISYYILLVSIGTAVCGKHCKNLFRFSAFLSLMLACGHLHDHEIIIPLWSSHFGATVVIYLGCFRLILELLNNATIIKKYFYYTLLSALIFFTSLSDPFFFVLLLGTIPAALLALALHKKIRSSFMLGLFLLLVFIGGIAFLCNFYDLLNLHIRSFIHLKANTAPLFHFTLASFTVLHKMLALYYAHNPIIIFLSFSYIFIGLALFFFRSTQNTPTLFITISVSFCILTTLFLTLFFDQDLLHPNFLSLRHFQPALLLPAFLCFPIFLAHSNFIIQVSHQYYRFFLFILISCLFLFQPYDSPQQMLGVYPTLTRCIDHYAKQGQLLNKNGISEYWDAHINDMLSKQHINIVAINRYKKPYNWMSTKHDYQNKKFHFILVREPTFSADTVIQYWGQPNSILICPYADNYRIFVYNEGFYIDSHTKLKTKT